MEGSRASQAETKHGSRPHTCLHQASAPPFLHQASAPHFSIRPPLCLHQASAPPFSIRPQPSLSPSGLRPPRFSIRPQALHSPEGDPSHIKHEPGSGGLLAIVVLIRHEYNFFDTLKGNKAGSPVSTVQRRHHVGSMDGSAASWVPSSSPGGCPAVHLL